MWLYVPNLPPEPCPDPKPQTHLASSISCPSAQGSAGSNLASSLPLTPWDMLHAASVTWRGKQEPPQVWSLRWKRGGFIRRLSGLTCSPLTAENGVDLFISSLRVTPVRTTASPGSALALGARGFSPPKSAALPPKAGLILSSVRTCRGTRTDSLKPLSRHWSDWATALRREYSVRRKPATPCGASDCSSWPAVRVATGSYTRDHGDPDKERLSLEGVAQQWAAPSVAVTDGSQTTRGGARSGELLLTGQAMEAAKMWTAPQAHDTRPRGAGNRENPNAGNACLAWDAMKWTAPSATDGGRGGTLTANMTGSSLAQQVNTLQWPAPAARDHKGANSADHLTVSTGSCHLDQLPNFVEHVFRPPSSPAPAIAAGSTCSTDFPNSNQPLVKRKLNPIFVEALMRWPTGLSGFERRETAWTRWWQLQRSFLSALDWGSSQERAQHDLFA